MAPMNLLPGQQWRNSYTDKPMDMVGGKEGEGEIYGEST